MLRALYLVLVVVACATGQAAVAQELISTEQGLSNRWTTCVVQDNSGMMWIGTVNGLNRYNGYEIEQFYAPQITNNNIVCLLKDNTGLIWVGTGDGLNLVNPLTGRIEKIPPPPNQATLSVRCIFQRNSGQIIVSDQNGTLYSITANKRLQRFLQMPFFVESTNRLPAPVDFIQEGKDGILWLITEYGFIYRYDGKTLVTKNGSFVTAKENYPVTLHLISKDTMLVGSRYSGLYYYCFGSGKMFTSPFLDSLNRISKLVYCSSQAGKTTYWIGYHDLKLKLIDLHNNKTITERYALPEELSITRAHRVHTATDQLLWICTDLGLWKIRPKNNFFTRHLVNYDKDMQRQTLNAHSLRAILPADNGVLYISSYKGFLTYDALHKTILKKTLFDIRGVRWAPFVRQMYNDHDLVWGVAEDGALFTLHKPSGIIKAAPVSYRPDYMPIHNYYTLLKVGHTCWIGTANGIYIYDTRSQKYVAFNETTFKGTSVFHLTLLPGNTIAASTSSGLYLITNNTVTKHYQVPELPSNEINYAIAFGDDLIYTATSNGLCRINTSTGEIRTFTMADGLCNNYINCLQAGNDSAIWVSTNFGLSRYDPVKNSFYNFYKKSGLCDNEFNRWSAASGNGTLYFGTVNGMISFNPATFNTTKKNAPRLFVSSLTRHSYRNDSVIQTRFFGSGNLPDLSVRDRYLEFSLGLTSYADVQNNRFFYRLTADGKTAAEWTAIKSDHKVRISNLESGNYTLQFRGVNSEGYEAANIISIPLSINEVYYKTWWFIGMEVLFVLGLILTAYKLRIRQLLRIQAIRTRIASDLHDEVGGILTRISIQSELLSHAQQAGSKQNEQLNRIAENSKHAIDMMGDVLWSIDARSDTVKNMLDRMYNHLGILQEKNIRCSITTDVADPDKTISSEKRQHIYLVFKEAVTNISKHSNATDVCIHLSIAHNKLYLRIADNGTNRSTNAGTGQGLRNMKMRAGKLKGTLVVESQEEFIVLLEAPL